MKNSDILKQQRTAIVDQMVAITEKAKTESRDLSSDEEAEFDSFEQQANDLQTKIERSVKAEALELEVASRTAKPVETTVVDGEGKEKDKLAKRFSLTRAIRLVSDKEKLDGAEKEVHELGLLEDRSAGVNNSELRKNFISIPVSFLTRASQQTVSQDSGLYGGKLVSAQDPVMFDSLRPKLFLETIGANFMSGLTGDVPLISANDFSMSFVAETADVTPIKNQFDGPVLSPKRASGAVDVSNRLLMQSSIDVEAKLMEMLNNGFLRLLNGAAINGSGVNSPTGLLSLPDVNVAAGTTAVAATWAKVVELQGLIEEDDATENSLAYLLDPKLKAALKQITKDAGSGRFLYEDGFIDGINAISTSLVPTLTGNRVLIYGDFSQMSIGQWGSVNILVDPYTASTSNSTRLVLNTYADMQVANQKAFAKNAFLTA